MIPAIKVQDQPHHICKVVWRSSAVVSSLGLTKLSKIVMIATASTWLLGRKSNYATADSICTAFTPIYQAHMFFFTMFE